MVDILVNGTALPKERGYTVVCRKCRSLLKVKHFEGRPVPDRRDGDGVVFGCPVCLNEIWVSESAHIRRLAAGY